MNTRLDKPAIGVTFAAVGIALCLAVSIGTHLLRVHGPAIREWIHASLPAVLMASLALACLCALQFWRGESR